MVLVITTMATTRTNSKCHVKRHVESSQVVGCSSSGWTFGIISGDHHLTWVRLVVFARLQLKRGTNFVQSTTINGIDEQWNSLTFTFSSSVNYRWRQMDPRRQIVLLFVVSRTWNRSTRLFECKSVSLFPLEKRNTYKSAELEIQFRSSLLPSLGRFTLNQANWIGEL